MEEFDGKFKNLHLDNTKKYFEELVEQSGVNVEENRKTVKEYNELKDNLSKIKKKLNLWRFLRVLMIITLVLIPLVIIKITPKIRSLRSEIEQVDKKIQELLDIAQFADNLPGVRKIHILPYHAYGKGKYEGLGREYPMGDVKGPSDSQMEAFKALIESKTSLHCYIGG